MKKMIFGSEKDRMPDWAFRIMAFMFNAVDLIKSPNSRLEPFSISEGQIIIDWGCGTGRFLRSASSRVGDKGMVYAVDIHPLAVESARQKILKYHLRNVTPLLTDGKTVDIPSHTANLIYALDMFHMVSDPKPFLRLLFSLARPDGILILEDGHQPREQTIEKINGSGYWDIIAENKSYITCKPSQKQLQP
jgi:ubiquinone/menaquinone biosynthesis C-methylase UbiE